MNLKVFWGEQPGHWSIDQWPGTFLKGAGSVRGPISCVPSMAEKERRPNDQWQTIQLANQMKRHANERFSNFDITTKDGRVSVQCVKDNQGRWHWRAQAIGGGRRWVVIAEDPITALCELERQARELVVE